MHSVTNSVRRFAVSLVAVFLVLAVSLPLLAADQEFLPVVKSQL
jgi:uncharacterized membrane protein (DUF485 family)